MAMAIRRTSESDVRRRRRILVVDDHFDTARSMAMTLSMLGHEVEFAMNGSSALALCDVFRPNVVFVDMNLPDLHGADLSRQLRIKAEPFKIRVIALTGYGESERPRALSAGCDAFVRKPLDWNHIDTILGSGAAA